MYIINVCTQRQIDRAQTNTQLLQYRQNTSTKN